MERITETHKFCPACGTWKLFEGFSPGTAVRSGLASHCKSCQAKRTREAYHRRSAEENKLRNRAQKMKSNFGITLERYDEMSVEQDGACVCGAPPESSQHGRLVVDHDHETGTVRGLLCTSCNMGLGLVDDDPARLRLLAAYVLEARK